MTTHSEMIIICCVCGRVRHDSEWVAQDAFPPGAVISHGYCPACAEAAFDELRAYHDLNPHHLAKASNA